MPAGVSVTVRQLCMRSGRWSACSAAARTCSDPKRALRRSSNWCRPSPARTSSCNRLALSPASACVCKERKRSWSTGAGRVTRASCSDSRRARCAMSCVGCAVRNSMQPKEPPLWCASTCKALERRGSSSHRNSNASAPCWRARSHTCSCASRRRAPNNRAVAFSTLAANSRGASNTSGRVNQG